MAYSMGSTAALGQFTPAAESSVPGVGGKEDSPVLTESKLGTVPSQPPSSETTDGQTPDGGWCDWFCRPLCCARWTASADFITLDRIGSVHYTLVSMVPHSNFPGPGAEMLNASDLEPGFAGGPRFGLVHHGDDGQDLEVSYFQIDGWSDFRGVGDPQSGTLQMIAPGGFVQNPNDAGQGMYWLYSSQLYTTEVNMRWNRWDRVTVLAGFRWFDLTEDLQGILLPPHTDSTGSFWDSHTKNNLYGLQVGADVKLLERDRFSIDGVVKTGVFDNHAEETTFARMQRVQYGESDSTDHLAFVGEIGLQCKYQVTRRLLVRAGYEAMWLEGVALAPGQIAETSCHYVLLDWVNTYVTPLGVNCNSGVFYHGANVGLEYSF
jgi:hypothetical protein